MLVSRRKTTEGNRRSCYRSEETGSAHICELEGIANVILEVGRSDMWPGRLFDKIV